ncbi:ImmA/IrrE family metallo-endopeptidase [Actinomadura sp. NAK00032]|nr:ImmA/IrrE family metallo-endopeptidase [Actinomadura sp. NAK00032]
MQALALDLRAEVGLTYDAPFDPYRLCSDYGVPVYPIEGLSEFGCPADAIEYFTLLRPGMWSAALIPHGTARFIVENTAHEPVRRRSNVTHEVGHLILEHEFDGALLTDEGCRKMNPQAEKEAVYLSAELLVPKKAAIRAAFAGHDNARVAREFNVSERFAQWRMDASGARRIAQRSRARS